MIRSNPPEPNPALKKLEVLVGRWEMELSNADFLPDRSAIVKGIVTIEWVEDGASLILRMGDRTSGSSSATWLIHRDESSPDYKVFYYDDRKVSRIYEMSFAERSWRLWRKSPNFSQRFEGEISEDGHGISAQWEKSNDGLNWEHDFDVRYTRME